MHHKGFFTSVLNIQVIRPIKLYTAWGNDFFFEWYVFALELSSFFFLVYCPGLCFAKINFIVIKKWLYSMNNTTMRGSVKHNLYFEPTSHQIRPSDQNQPHEFPACYLMPRWNGFDQSIKVTFMQHAIHGGNLLYNI